MGIVVTFLGLANIGFAVFASVAAGGIAAGAYYLASTYGRGWLYAGSVVDAALACALWLRARNHAKVLSGGRIRAAWVPAIAGPNYFEQVLARISVWGNLFPAAVAAVVAAVLSILALVIPLG